jgi:ribose 5-phosphate isomerase B
MKVKYFIASDHAGFNLKEKLCAFFKENKVNFKDIGPFKKDPLDDFNDFAKKLISNIKNKNQKGILICGTGEGMSIQANKFKEIRCALCWRVEIAKQSREHLDSNVIALPANFLTFKKAKEIILVWMNTKKINLNKYNRRIKKFEIR